MGLKNYTRPMGQKAGRGPKPGPVKQPKMGTAHTVRTGRIGKRGK